MCASELVFKNQLTSELTSARKEGKEERKDHRAHRPVLECSLCGHSWSKKGSSKREGFLISFSSHFLSAGWSCWFSVRNLNSRKTVLGNSRKTILSPAGGFECVPLNHGWKGSPAGEPGSSQPPGRGWVFSPLLSSLSLCFKLKYR